MAVVVLIVALAGISLLLFATRGPETGQERETEVWWIASDPHVGHFSLSKPDGPLNVAIDDVNEYIENIEGVKVNGAILLGDLLHESDQYKALFYQDMENLNVDNWYYVLGNHDFNNPPFTENLLPPVDTTLDVMGMKWILISCHTGDTGSYPASEVAGGPLRMPENVRTWFVNQVLTSDEPVFVFSHQAPSDWKAWNENLKRVANGSELMGWFYGHIHAWSATLLEDQVLSFSDCSIDWVPNYQSAFMFLEREGNTVNVTLKFRDHFDHIWIKIPFQGKNVDNISFSVQVA